MASSRILMVDDEVDLELLVRQRFRRRIRKGDFEFLPVCVEIRLVSVYSLTADSFRRDVVHNTHGPANALTQTMEQTHSMKRARNWSLASRIPCWNSPSASHGFAMVARARGRTAIRKVRCRGR